MAARPARERPEQHGGRAPVLGPEAAVAARAGEAVGLSHRRAADDLGVEIEIVRRAWRTMASCWKSFSPKKARHGPASESSLVTTVATPAKWPGRDGALEEVAERPGLDHRRAAPRPGTSRSPKGRRRARRPPPRPSRGPVSRFDGYRARSSADSELERVHEDGRRDDVAGRDRRSKQRQVPLVQRSHRRDEPEPATWPRVPTRSPCGTRRGRRLPPRTGPGRPRTRVIRLGTRDRWLRVLARGAAGRGRPRRRSRRARPGRAPGGAARSCSRSPRAAGPVSAAAGPRRPTSSRAPRARGKKASSGSPTVGGDALDLAEERHEVVGGDAGGGVVLRPCGSAAITSGRPPSASASSVAIWSPATTK